MTCLSCKPGDGRSGLLLAQTGGGRQLWTRDGTKEGTVGFLPSTKEPDADEAASDAAAGQRWEPKEPPGSGTGKGL